MSTGIVFLNEISITLIVVVLFLGYLRPFLRRILIDLCDTDDRALFWTTFTNIVLLSLPLISALGFVPPISKKNLIIEVMHQLKSNLTNFMLGLALVGFVLLFFSASASKYQEKNLRVASKQKGIYYEIHRSMQLYRALCRTTPFYQR